MTVKRMATKKKARKPRWEMLPAMFPWTEVSIAAFICFVAGLVAGWLVAL